MKNNMNFIYNLKSKLIEISKDLGNDQVYFESQSDGINLHISFFNKMECNFEFTIKLHVDFDKSSLANPYGDRSKNISIVIYGFHSNSSFGCSEISVERDGVMDNYVDSSSELNSKNYHFEKASELVLYSLEKMKK